MKDRLHRRQGYKHCILGGQCLLYLCKLFILQSYPDYERINWSLKILVSNRCKVRFNHEIRNVLIRRPLFYGAR